MDEFFKTKVGFTIGLLATVFTIKPLIDANGGLGFTVFGLKVTVQYAYLFLMACLGLAVYFISLQFASEKHVEILDKASDACYAVALATPPLFVTFWILTIVADALGKAVVQRGYGTRMNYRPSWNRGDAVLMAFIMINARNSGTRMNSAINPCVSPIGSPR